MKNSNYQYTIFIPCGSPMFSYFFDWFRHLFYFVSLLFLFRLFCFRIRISKKKHGSAGIKWTGSTFRNPEIPFISRAQICHTMLIIIWVLKNITLDADNWLNLVLLGCGSGYKTTTKYPDIKTPFFTISDKRLWLKIEY